MKNHIKNIAFAKIVRLAFIYSFVSLLIISCNSPIQETGAPRKLSRNIEYWHNQGIPIADTTELSMYYGVEAYDSTGVLDYRFARDYAFAEFYSSIFNYYYDMGNSEWWLRFQTEYAIGDTTSLRFGDVPVVVYDYDNKPYYYEFPVIYDGYIEGQVVGTVTVAAQPTTNELVQYVFTAGLVYHPANFYYKRYVGAYPNVFLSEDGGSFFKLSWSDNEQSITLQQVDNPYLITGQYDDLQEMIQELSSTELAEMNADLSDESYEILVDDTYANVTSYTNSFSTTTDTQEYWSGQLNDYNASSSFSYSPELLSWIDERINSIDRGVVGFLNEYSSNALRMTIWTDACGPSIMSWLYRGKYNKFNNKYLPLYGDAISQIDYPSIWIYPYHICYCMTASADEYGIGYGYALREFNSNRTDGGLYYTFFQHSRPIGDQYALFDDGLRQSLREATNNAYRIKFITAPISWMINNEQPVVVEGIRGEPHYWGAIGYAYNKGWFGVKLNMRILVMDNGYFSCSENNAYYYPYWSILGGLNYAWKQQ